MTSATICNLPEKSTKLARNHPVQLAKAFDLANVPAELIIPGFSPDHSMTDLVPAIDPSHSFDLDQIRVILAFFSSDSPDGLYLVGPTGSGKSSLIRQTAARMHWPLFEITANQRLEYSSLIGQWALIKGDFEWIDGPLTRAFREGGIFLLNEVDTMDPAELSALNGILDGAALCITEKGGEIVQRHPDFKMVLTGNSNGTGDDTGLYRGVGIMNLSFMDRVMTLEVDYLQAAQEKVILKNASGDMLPEVMLDALIELANNVRTRFKKGDLNCTFSTRTLLRVIRTAIQFQKLPNPMQAALNTSLLLRVNKVDSEAIQALFKTHFGV